MPPDRPPLDPEVKKSLLADLAKQTPPTETWRDWMPEGAAVPDVLSRDELLEELAKRGTDISSYTLEHYRRNGVLPRPIRQRHFGVTQAVYPYWFVPAIEQLKQLQAEGKSLEEIRPWMRAWALTAGQWIEPLVRPIVNARAALTELAKAYDTPEGVVRISFTTPDGQEKWSHTWEISSDD